MTNRSIFFGFSEVEKNSTEAIQITQKHCIYSDSCVQVKGTGQKSWLHHPLTLSKLLMLSRPQFPALKRGREIPVLMIVVKINLPL